MEKGVCTDRGVPWQTAMRELFRLTLWVWNVREGEREELGMMPCVFASSRHVCVPVTYQRKGIMERQGHNRK